MLWEATPTAEGPTMTVPGMYREVNILIDADPEVVYDLVSDLSRMGEWSPENRGGEWTDGGSGNVGDRLLGHNKIGEYEWSVPVEVTVADRGQSFQFITSPDEEDGPYVRWTYNLSGSDEGTRLTEIWDVETLPGGLKKMDEEQLAGRARAVEAAMNATLSGIKAAIEG
jgi:hypothetical protein